VQNILQQVGLAFIYGPSMAGKTFLALDLMFSIARGVDWFGHKTKPAHVFYLPLEAGTGIRNRVAAWEAANVNADTSLFHMMAESKFSLGDGCDVDGVVEWVMKDGGEGSVVVVDTFARATPGMDENSSEKMGAAIAEADRIAEAIKGLVVVVHHTGKDATKGIRGSSSLLGAADTVIEVTGGNATPRGWKLEKSKEGKGGAQFAFKLEVHELYKDEFDGQVTSCTVAPDTAVDEARKSDAKAHRKNQTAILAAVLKALEAAPMGAHGAPPTAPALTLEQAVMAGKMALDIPDGRDRRKEAAKRVIVSLIADGSLQVAPGFTALKPMQDGDAIWKTLAKLGSDAT
jgi:hypothetical protein